MQTFSTILALLRFERTSIARKRNSCAGGPRAASAQCPATSQDIHGTH